MRRKGRRRWQRGLAGQLWRSAAAAAGSVLLIVCATTHIFIEWTRTEKSNQVNWTAIKMCLAASSNLTSHTEYRVEKNLTD